MKPVILVVGSSNTDMVVKADHLPFPGETIIGGTFFMNPGGKGANQAVAASRLGGSVTFIARTGNDVFGRQSLQLFEDEGIDTSMVQSDPKNPSGVALITVDKNAENCIVVASGANAALTPKSLAKAEPVISTASIVLMQLEIPIETVTYVASVAAASNVRVLLNPAPACEIPAELMKNISVLTPNKNEAEMLSGITISDLETATAAANVIRAKGAGVVIITLGSKGALVVTDTLTQMVEAPKVKAIDTTAAGDVFNGALAVALSQQKSITEAVEFACHAAAVSVTRMGAQASAPFLNQVSMLEKK